MPLCYRHNSPDLHPRLPKAPDPPSDPEEAAIPLSGVTATIVDVISREQGGSVSEIMAVLVRKFPERDADGMRSTARIQANRHCSSKDREEKQGLVYYRYNR